jgi:murein DD-endopeptidase MepM/ murein hydrolase activator NlpD
MRNPVAGAFLAAAVLAGTAGHAQVPSLALPIDCRIGLDCEIQNHVDLDPGPAVRDYQCGSRTYQGHTGVDFRLPDLVRQRQGVAVLAAADGRVMRVRDGVEDMSVRTSGVAAVHGLECGNGVAIRHPGGIETRYCHLANGSIRVRPGDRVKAGDALGRVGLSGRTEYPHLHFSVHQGPSVIDPFAYGAAAGTCQAGRSLWRAELRESLAYKARAVLNTGFSAQPPSMADIEEGPRTPTPDAAAVLAYARGIGLKAGDVQTLTLEGPDGAVLAVNTATVPHDQAQNLIFAGARRPGAGWAKGRYLGDYVVHQGGQVVLHRRFEFRL